MDHDTYARLIRDKLAVSPVTPPSVKVDETRRRNAGKVMVAAFYERLAQNGDKPQHVRHSLVSWKGGTIGLRNSRIADFFWTNLFPSTSEEMHVLAQREPVAYVLAYWDLDGRSLHSWVVPEDVFYVAIQDIECDAVTGRKTILVSPEDHQLKNAADVISFSPYYVRSPLTDAEYAKLIEAIKTDDSIKQQRRSQTDDDSGDESETDEDEPSPIYTAQTVAFVQELPGHASDMAWHEANKHRYQLVLRGPTQALVDQLRTQYMQRLAPEVAGGKHQLSRLKKNDFGKGTYHDHYWFAFYDPAAGSKTKSVQLFFTLAGKHRVWRYGLSMGKYCGEYLERLLTVLHRNRRSVGKYIRQAPLDTIVRIFEGDEIRQLTVDQFAEAIETESNDVLGSLANLDIIREFPLVALPEHSERIVDEVGAYFTWLWPLFDAAITGKWPLAADKEVMPSSEEEIIDVDEDAPNTLSELADLTSLPVSFLDELEEALLAKQQAILVGPPGTSKTYIAKQFARYFVRQRQGQPQGSFNILYVHASWAYEDFFEGLKPVSKDGSLTFEPRPGYFLTLVEGLKAYHPQARHVLVMDEINRCDTAAVLGELLQLLEYRGTTVQLLSGRNFVLPDRLYVIGTMNSADRSIGRMDLALRRRFLWLDLHPQVEILDRWLKRPGNNPSGFQAERLAHCNKLLGEHGIPPEQQIGHALFMLQRTNDDEAASPSLDVPLSKRKLLQVVRFSVLPYLRELLTMQFGQADPDLLQQIRDLLLDLEPPNAH